jgi:hypothetical protein
MLTLDTNETMNIDLSPKSNMELNLTPKSNMEIGISVPKNVSSSLDYERLRNKPQIESVELIGNKSFDELGLTPLDADDLIEILN